MLFPILDRVLIIETLKTLLLVMSVLLLMVLTNALVALLSDVVAGSIGMDVLGALLLINVINLTGFMLPPAFFFSILWVLGRMYRDSEVSALQAAGIGSWRIYRPFFVLSLPLAAVVAVLVLVLYPLAKGYGDQLEAKASKGFEISGFRAGAFNEFNNGRFMAYVASLDKDDEVLKDVFVRYRLHDQPGVLVAQKARIRRAEAEGGRFLVLYDGHRYQGIPGIRDFSVAAFSEYGIRLPEDEEQTAGRSHTAIPTSELMHATHPKLKAELQRRFAAPLSLFALMLVSIPLAKSGPRQGAYGRLIVAVVIYALFMNMMQLAVQWMAKGRTPEWMGVWWVPVITMLLALLIAYVNSMGFASRWRRFWLKRLGKIA